MEGFKAKARASAYLIKLGWIRGWFFVGGVCGVCVWGCVVCVCGEVDVWGMGVCVCVTSLFTSTYP